MNLNYYQFRLINCHALVKVGVGVKIRGENTTLFMFPLHVCFSTFQGDDFLTCTFPQDLFNRSVNVDWPPSKGLVHSTWI